MYRAPLCIALLVALGGCASAAYGGGGAGPAPGGPTKDEAAQATVQGKADWSVDWCQDSGWYGDGECDWFCPRHDPDCDAPPLGPDPSGSPTRYPIVLAHGFAASPTNQWRFHGIAEALRADGDTVVVATVPPFASAEDRAGYLAEYVDQALDASGADKVDIIAHSMGGLDTRALVSPGGLDYGDRVASVTTISTPNHGTRIADVALGLLPTAADGALDALARAYGNTFSDVADDTDLRAALESLSLANADDFAASYPDAPGVYYQSWAGVSSITGRWDDRIPDVCEGKVLFHPGTMDRVEWQLAAIAVVVGWGGKPNDGMATVESAKYGNFRGCIPADHLDEVGANGVVGDTGWDAVRFYRNVAFDLSARGF